MQGLLNEAQDYRDRMVEWRRNIHSCPETGFHLPKTSAMVAGVLEKLGFQVRTGFAESAVLGILETGRPGNTIAVRADMDALGMQDEKDVPYRSVRDGVCHACGHDVHTALCWAGILSFRAQGPDSRRMRQTDFPACRGRPCAWRGKAHRGFRGVGRRGCHIRSPLPATISGRCDGMQVRKLFCQR